MCLFRSGNKKRFQLSLCLAPGLVQSGVIATGTIMIICSGVNKNPLVMDRNMEYCISQIMNRCSALVENGNILYLMYHPGMYVSLKTPATMIMACQMVVDYHSLISEVEPDKIDDVENWVNYNSLCLSGEELYNSSEDDERSDEEWEGNHFGEEVSCFPQIIRE